MQIGKLTLAAALGSAIAALGGQTCRADDDGTNVTKRCVNLRQIDRTDVVSDDTILFYMRDGTIFRNHLPHRCPQLKARDVFMYRVTLPQLCDVDVITVLDRIGPGFMPGASCGLGRFDQISKETASQIERAAEESERK